jgi:hypothetical protein
MSHYDHFKYPSYVIFACALILGLVAFYVGPNGAGFILLSWALIGWGIVLSARERERDGHYWKNVATGLADQLIDRQNETCYYQRANDIIEMMETIHGGRVYHGPITAADIHQPLLTNGEEA